MASSHPARHLHYPWPCFGIDRRKDLHARVDTGTSSAPTAWPLEANIHKMHTDDTHSEASSLLHLSFDFRQKNSIKLADYSLGSHIELIHKAFGLENRI